MAELHETESDRRDHLIPAEMPSVERAAEYARRVRLFQELLSAENPGVPVYIDWSEVPEGLRTRDQWDDDYYRVPSGTTPAGIVVWWQPRQVRDDDRNQVRMIDVVCRPVRLYSPEQVRSFTPTPRYLAHRAFYDIFVRPANRQRYAWWDDGHWKFCRGKLSKQKVQQHVHGNEMYAVYGGRKTRFLAVDLDLHGGDQAIFIEQLELLLESFGHKNGWHVQVANENANGVHLLRVLRTADLEDARRSLRNILEVLDSQNPLLAHKARHADMKTLGQLEIFPDRRQAFRLPLCRGRTVLLDRPLELMELSRTKRPLVQDVEGYVNWLNAKDSDSLLLSTSLGESP